MSFRTPRQQNKMPHPIKKSALNFASTDFLIVSINKKLSRAYTKANAIKIPHIDYESNLDKFFRFYILFPLMLSQYFFEPLLYY